MEQVNSSNADAMRVISNTLYRETFNGDTIMTH
jgi:hypothetical protein